jgi:hypothetical protein
LLKTPHALYHSPCTERRRRGDGAGEGEPDVSISVLTVSKLFPFPIPVSGELAIGYINVSNVSIFFKESAQSASRVVFYFSFKTLPRIWKHWKHFWKPLE